MLPHTHRGHSLTGRIPRDTLHHACKAVKRNRGAAGLDTQSIKRCEAHVEENLLALMRALKSGTYPPIPLRRVYIPKGTGVLRPLGIPAVRCRVAQEVIRALIEPIFAPTFHDRSHGFRRPRSRHMAMAQLVERHPQGDRRMRMSVDFWIMHLDASFKYSRHTIGVSAQAGLSWEDLMENNLQCSCSSIAR